MSDTILYVTYFINQQSSSTNSRSRHLNSVASAEGLEGEALSVDPLSKQKEAVDNFLLNASTNTSVAASYTEILENRKTHKWPALIQAIGAAREHKATLLIAELGTLTSSDSFTECLLNSKVDFKCCDQEYMNPATLEAFSKHDQVHRKMHGKLIREGLKMTSAKSGNPNAAEVISKVNKPKIDTAIVFAFLLQIIISDYKRRGYSQRHMVKTLNDEGFTAPEGGKWVLSQLQKVLDRVRLNEIATEFEPILEEFKNKNLSPLQMAEELNNRSVPSLKRSQWDETQVKKLIERVGQISDIILINRFVLNLLPIIQNFSNQGLNVTTMLKEFKKVGIPIRRMEASAIA
ncbi:MAG: recombinase family protein [Francisellaceae bacterium]|nr:recombinase family protein [Francisellaceae bacterium]